MNVSDSQRVHVYTVHDDDDAEVIREALDGEGIPCEIEPPSADSRGVPNIRLLVPPDYVTDARAFLVELEARFSDEEE